jgi:hypothetical protein
VIIISLGKKKWAQKILTSSCVSSNALITRCGQHVLKYVSQFSTSCASYSYFCRTLKVTRSSKDNAFKDKSKPFKYKFKVLTGLLTPYTEQRGEILSSNFTPASHSEFPGFKRPVIQNYSFFFFSVPVHSVLKQVKTLFAALISIIIIIIIIINIITTIGIWCCKTYLADKPWLNEG